MDDKLKVCFDKEYKIRVLDPVKSERTEDLQAECTKFNESKFGINLFGFNFISNMLLAIFIFI